MGETDEKKPARGGIDAARLEALADEMARRARFSGDLRHASRLLQKHVQT